MSILASDRHDLPTMKKGLLLAGLAALDPKNAERKRRRPAGRAVPDLDQLEAAAAEIADDARGAGKGRDDAHAGKTGVIGCPTDVAG